MKPHPLSSVSPKPGKSERFQLLRRRKEKAAHWLIAFGGVGVVCAMVLILFYLLWVVLPLFFAPSTQTSALGERAAWAEDTRLMALDERGDVGLRVGAEGSLAFFRLPDVEPLGDFSLPLENAGAITAAVQDLEDPERVAVATDQGRILVFDYGFQRAPGAPGQERQINPVVEFPIGQGSEFFVDGPIDHLDISDRETRLVLAAVAGDLLVVDWRNKESDFLTGEVRFDSNLERHTLGFEATGLVLDGNQRWVYIGDNAGRIHRFDLPALTPSGVLQLGDAPITAMISLLGGVSLIAGDADGRLFQAFPVRDAEDQYELTLIREFPALAATVESIMPERRRRGFAAVDRDGALGLYHSTAGSQVLETRLPSAATAGLAFAPRADQLLHLDDTGRLSKVAIDNPHPEVSLKTLWNKVWYENYTEPDHVWQSTASNVDFEPKLSLTPLAFGTLKASLYAMLFAVPIALLGATYTAVFMAPALRRKIKPTIELMAALPTVILGFLAGLWLAPFIENQLAGLFAMIVIVPIGLLAFAFGWSRPAVQAHFSWVRGWEPLLLLPVLVALVAASLWLAPPLQQWVFGGDLREWLSSEAGISFDQRNAIVVGIAMGFSVIPIIFSIAEDALYAVPTSLTDGSLALGATRWQSLVRIVLPTASPGIFSGLMIGLGRAVGETMIVLMATGNTPIMSWSLFDGMRTLAANIVIEMPESAVASTHFRVLFLSALVLFLFTFLVNTVAELIRQRLRDRYASL